MEKTETTLYGKRAIVPTIYLKDLKAKEAAVAALETETDSVKRDKLYRKIRSVNRKVPGCVVFLD